MTDSEKKIGVVLFLAWLLSGSKSKKPKKGPSSSKESPPLPGRPESTKEEPTPEPTPEPTTEPTPSEEPDETVTVRERLKLEQEQAKHRPKGGVKPPPKKRTPKEQAKVEDQAVLLAEKMHDLYIERGELPEVAAADAMTLYLLAGGSDIGRIKGYQKLIGVPASGGYDGPTRDKVIELLDLATDRAVSNYMIAIHAGEDPRYAAAQAASVYVQEQQKDPEHIAIVPERFAALQQQFLSTPSGEYDQATKNGMVQFGVVPP